MAKPKKYISSKLKVKRKFLLGGDPGQELYLNNNTTYQAADAPTAMLQNQFEANEQLKAKQNTAIFGNQLAREMDYLQDLNANVEKRKKEEDVARQQQVATNKQAVDQQVTQTAGKAAKDLTKSIKSGLLTSAVPIATNYYSPTWASVNPMPAVPASYGTPMTVSPAMQTATSTTGDLFSGASTVGQNAATTTTASSFGQSAAAIGKSLGKSALVALPQIAGQITYNQLNKAADRDLKNEGRSQYYDDTEYSRKEFNAQLAKSTGKGATIGGTIGSMIPIPGVGTGLGMAIGAGVGAIAGAGKAIHQRRMTKSEDERGVKIGNKRFGKKLLFGEENVYDENLDPTVIEKRNREAQMKAMTDTATAMDNARVASMLTDVNQGFNLKNTPGQMAKYGGKIEYLQGGVAKSLGRGAKEYIGKSHEDGGIDLPGNIEVEGGETEQNNYIFSKHLKLHTGISYAQAHKNLLKSGASSEEIKQLALSQEAAAGRNPNEIKTMKFAKYGGPLMYKEGGNTETDPPKEGEGESDFDAKTKMRIHANEGVYSGGLTTPYLDSKGYWTVGHGHLLTKADGTPYTKNDKLPAEFSKITEQQIKDWAKSDYETLKQAAINWIGEDKWKELPEPVKSGAIELAYGLGPVKLKKFDDTREYILAGDYESAAENISRSKYFKDVAERRGTQVAALIGGDEEVFTNSASKDQYTVPKEKAMPYLTKGKQLQTTNTNQSAPIGVSPKTTVLPDGTEVDLGEDTGNSSGLTETIDRKNLRFESSNNPADEADGLTAPVEIPKTKRNLNFNDNLENDIVTEVTDAKTGQKIQLNPERPVDGSIVDLKKREEPLVIQSKGLGKYEPKLAPYTLPTVKEKPKKNKSSKTPSIEVGPINYEILPEEEKKKAGIDGFKTLAYASQFAQPAYALLNPYKSVYNEAPVSIDRGLSGMVPTVATNINLGRVSPAQAIAEQQAATNAVIQQASNMGGPASAAVQLAALEKNKAGIASATNAANTANTQLAAQETNARLTASAANQRAAQNAIQLQSQLGAQQAQMDAARNARIAAAKEAANSERYLNTAGAIGAAGAGIGNMYRDQTQLDTQYKVALATDPTGSAARWLQANDPNAYARYVQENATTKKFGGPKNSYISRLGELTKRPLKAKI